MAYFLIMALSILLISIDDFDLETNFTAVAVTLNNIGPGLEKVGPTMNYSGYSAFSTCVLIFDMIAGRLEILPVLVLFSVHTWKEGSLFSGRGKARHRAGEEDAALLDEGF